MMNTKPEITIFTQLNEIATPGMMARLFTQELPNHGVKVKTSPAHGHAQTYYSPSIPKGGVGITERYHAHFAIPPVAQPIQPEASIYRPSATFPLAPGFYQVYGKCGNVWMNSPLVAKHLESTQPKYSLNPLLPPISEEMISEAMRDQYVFPNIPKDYVKCLMCGKFIGRKNLHDALSTVFTNLNDLKIALILKIYPPNSGEMVHKIVSHLEEIMKHHRREATNVKVFILADHLNDEDFFRLVAATDIYFTVSKLQDLDLTALIAGRMGKVVVMPGGLGYDVPFMEEQVGILYGPNSFEPIMEAADSGGQPQAQWGRINLGAAAYALRAAHGAIVEGPNPYGPKAQQALTAMLDPVTVCNKFMDDLLRPYGDAF